jgi:hypothetical protein
MLVVLTTLPINAMEQKKDSSKTEVEEKKAHQLWQLNIIQARDYALTQELCKPLNSLIDLFIGKTHNIQKNEPLRKKEEILNDMHSNMQKYHEIFPETPVDQSQWNGKKLDQYRMMIANKKVNLNPNLVSTPFERLILPDEDFLKKIELLTQSFKSNQKEKK